MPQQSNDPLGLGLYDPSDNSNDPLGLGLYDPSSSITSTQSNQPQSWFDWGIEQALRTGPPVIGGLLGAAVGAPEGGIGAVPMGALGAASGQVLGQSWGDWWSGKESSPAEYIVGAGAAAIPGFLGASRAATPGLRLLGNIGRGAIEGATTNLATSPFEEWAQTGNWMPSNERLAGSALSGAGFGGAFGGGFSLLHGGPRPVEAAPPPPAETAPRWDVGLGGKGDYGTETPPLDYNMPRGDNSFQQNFGFDDPTQGQLNLGPYRAPSGRMTNTGPGREPRFMGPEPQPPAQGVPESLPFDFSNQGDLFGGNPPPGVPPLSREDLMRQGWTKSPSGGLIAPNSTFPPTPPPPNEPPAGGAGVVAPPPAAPPVTQAQGGWQPVITNEGQVATLPPGYGANDVAMLRQQGFVPVQGMRSPDGYIMMFKGDAAVQAAIAQRRGNRPAGAPPPVVRPDVPSAIGPGQQAAGDVVPIPNEKASDLRFVRNMEAGGYVVSHKDATTTYFVKADEEPAFQRVFGDDESRMRPGEQPRGVAPFPSRARNLFEITQELQQNPQNIEGIMTRAQEIIDNYKTSSQARTDYSEVASLVGRATNPNEAEFLQHLADSIKEKGNELNAAETQGFGVVRPVNEMGFTSDSGEPPPLAPSNIPPMDPRMAGRVEQGGQTEFGPRVPPQQGQLMPMEVGPQQQGMSDKDMLNLRAQQILGEDWGETRQPVQQSMIPMFQDAEASELMRRMGIDTSGRHGMPTAEEGPSFARVQGGGYKASMNTERGIENITRDYTSPLSAIMSREGLQNAMDAAESLGGDGIVKIRLNSTNKTIEIYDNGKGMDDATIGSKLFEAFSSGKEGEEGATGGKGIGSAAYIYGGKQFQIETVAVDGTDGLKYRIETSGTPKQFMLGQSETFSRDPVSADTPTGTTIKIVLKDNHSIYDAQKIVEKIRDHSRNRSSRLVVDAYGDTSGTPLSEIEHTVHPQYGDMDNISDTRFTSSNDDKMIGDFTTTNRNSQVKVLIPKGPTVESNYITVHYLNNGMYQFSDQISLNTKAEVPKRVLVDIHPLADDLDELYPFINTREDVKKDIREEVTQFVTENIGKPAVSKRKNRTQELYDSMSPVQVGGTKRKPIIYDPGMRLTPQEMDTITRSPVVQRLIRVYDNAIDDVLQVAGKQKWIDRLEGVGLVMDPGMHGVHIPNPTTGKSTILINPFIRIEAGASPKDVGWHSAHTGLHEVAHIGKEAGSSLNLTPEDMNDPRLGEFLQSYMNEIIQHGDTGWQSTGHGMDFAQRLGEVYANAGVARTFSTADRIRAALTDQSGGYSPEVQRLLQLYTDSRGRNPTTEDLLSGTGVKSADRGRYAEGSISGNREANGDGVAAEVDAHFNRLNDHPAVAKLRGLPKSNEGNFNNTYFILPDGSRHSIGDDITHNMAAQTVGTDLTEVLGAGVVRYTGNGIEVGGRITHAQAEQVKYSMELDAGPTGRSTEMWVDVRQPDGKMKSKMFDNRASAEAIRNWVNSHYMAEDVPRFSRVKPEGQMPPAPPGKEANDASTWRRIKENAGWGQGESKPPVKKDAKGKKSAEINYLHEILALPSGATTTMDFSAPGRNGLTMVLTPQFWKATGAMFKGLSKEGFDVIDKDLRSKPIFQKKIDMETGAVGKSTAEEAGMKLFKMASDAPLSERAQNAASRWLETGGSIPYASAAYRNTAGVPIRMTNRAYITFLNHLNANRFEYLMNKSRDMAIQGLETGKVRQGMMPWSTKVSPSEAMELNPYTNVQLSKHIADFVNTATGHGPLKTHIYPHRTGEVSLEESAGTLSKFLFSQGQLASRVRMLNPNTYIMATPFVRKQYMKAALSQAAAWAAFATMAKMAGGEVGTEGTSADFGKIKIGDTRIDPGSGFLQFMVLFDRMYQGGYTSSATGEFHKFGEGFQAETQMSNLMRFGSNKLNPVWKFAYDMASATQYNPFHVYDRSAQLAVPLYVQDIIGVVKENPEMIPWLAPMAFGIGAQTYSKGESVGKLIAPENDWMATGGGPADLGPDELNPSMGY